MSERQGYQTYPVDKFLSLAKNEKSILYKVEVTSIAPRKANESNPRRCVRLPISATTTFEEVMEALRGFVVEHGDTFKLRGNDFFTPMLGLDRPDPTDGNPKQTRRTDIRDVEMWQACRAILQYDDKSRLAYTVKRFTSKDYYEMKREEAGENEAESGVSGSAKARGKRPVVKEPESDEAIKALQRDRYGKEFAEALKQVADLVEAKIMWPETIKSDQTEAESGKTEALMQAIMKLEVARAMKEVAEAVKLIEARKQDATQRFLESSVSAQAAHQLEALPPLENREAETTGGENIDAETTELELIESRKPWQDSAVTLRQKRAQVMNDDETAPQRRASQYEGQKRKLSTLAVADENTDGRRRSSWHNVRDAKKAVEQRSSWHNVRSAKKAVEQRFREEMGETFAAIRRSWSPWDPSPWDTAEFEGANPPSVTWDEVIVPATAAGYVGEQDADEINQWSQFFTRLEENTGESAAPAAPAGPGEEYFGEGSSEHREPDYVDFSDLLEPVSEHLRATRNDDDVTHGSEFT